MRGAHLTFLGNNAEGLSGGAMYLTSYTQVILFQGSTFDFINNTGRCVCACARACVCMYLPSVMLIQYVFVSYL